MKSWKHGIMGVFTTITVRLSWFGFFTVPVAQEIFVKAVSKKSDAQKTFVKSWKESTSLEGAFVEVYMFVELTLYPWLNAVFWMDWNLYNEFLVHVRIIVIPANTLSEASMCEWWKEMQVI